jgi:hypothetical protein
MLAQPLVPQKRRLAAFTAWVRRRMRRMAEARPVTDEVADRDIMVILACAFWRAVIRGMCDRLRGRGLVRGVLSDPERCSVSVGAGRERGLGALTGSSLRTGYLGEYGPGAAIRQSIDHHHRPRPRTARWWHLAIPVAGVAAGVAVSILVEAVAGFYPALRAAHSPPTDALRM